MKNILSMIVIWFISLILWVWFFTYKNSINKDKEINNKIFSDLVEINNILQKQSKYPKPWGTQIFYKKDWKVSLTWQRFDIIWWWLCWKDFSKLWITQKEPFHNKCYKYSVTKDEKHYQIWAIIKERWNYISYITWNSEENIIKDYVNEYIVRNDDKDRFPYNPYTKFLWAKILWLNIWESWKMFVIEWNWKSKQVKESDINEIQLNPFDTIILKWESSTAYIKFENEDFIKLVWNSIIKIKENEVHDETTNNNIFWLIWNITYSIYWPSNNASIQSPSQNLWIRWDILQWVSKINDGTFETNTQIKSKTGIKVKNDTHEIKSHKNIDKLLNWEISFNADILWKSSFDIENSIEIEK